MIPEPKVDLLFVKQTNSMFCHSSRKDFRLTAREAEARERETGGIGGEGKGSHVATQVVIWWMMTCVSQDQQYIKKATSVTHLKHT